MNRVGPVKRATITSNAAGWFEAVSPTFLALIDRPIEALAGLQVLDLMHPMDAPNVRRRLEAAAAAGSTVEPTTTSARIFDSAERWVPVELVLRGLGEGRVLIDVVFDEESPPDVDVMSSLPGVVAPPEVAPEVSSVFANFPGPDVPMQRLAVRATLGIETTPMIEIDPEGRTTYVHGDWKSLDDPGSVDDDRPAVDSFEDLLQRCGAVDPVGDAIGAVLDSGRRGRVELTMPDGRARWVHVVPIPNPLHAGVLNALVAVTTNPELGAFDANPASPRPAAAPAEAIQALARITAAQATRPRTIGSAAAGTVEVPNGHAPDPADLSAPEAAAVTPWWRAGGLERFLAERNLTRRQVGAAVAVVLFALLVRSYDLSILPRGLHGDEGITGLEAQRVLDEGSIGIYTGSALGQPTLPFYLNAITLALFGNTVWSMRIVAAIGGTLAVAAMYVVVQRRFDHRTGMAAAVALATMTWSIHFSRIAFGMAWWPLVTLLAVAAIDKAARNDTPNNWFVAGGLSIVGVYVYNSHWTFGLAVAGFLAIWLANKVRRRYALPRAVIFAPVGAFVIGLPMILFVLDSANGYFNHFDLVNRRSTPEWTEAGLFGKVELFVRWYLTTWNRLLFDPRVDGVDASGVIKQVPLIFVILGVVGLVTVLRRHRTPFVAMLLLTALVMPIGPAITFDAATRRDFAMVLTLAFLSGMGAISVISFVDQRVRAGLGRTVAAAIGVVVLFTSVVPYFTQFRRDPAQRWVFVEELALVADAVEMARQDRPVYVSFYSGRHYWEYSTLEYLLDRAPGVNRAPLDQGYIENPSLDLVDGVTGDQLFVFVGDYGVNLPALVERYPQGQLILDSQVPPRVVAYEVPG